MAESTTTEELPEGGTLDLVQDSLLRRMRTMHGLYCQAVGSMEPEHVNHFEREGVLPIAFSLFHYTNMHDGAFMMLESPGTAGSRRSTLGAARGCSSWLRTRRPLRRCA